MPRKQQVEVLVEETSERQQLHPAIGTHVMDALGRPGDLFKVHVRQLWEDHYRVNVYVGADAASAKVAHSYFVVGGSDDNIISCTPQITRQYEPAPLSRADDCGPSN